jgi:hypothetical protein
MDRECDATADRERGLDTNSGALKQCSSHFVAAAAQGPNTANEGRYARRDKDPLANTLVFAEPIIIVIPIAFSFVVSPKLATEPRH